MQYLSRLALAGAAVALVTVVLAGGVGAAPTRTASKATVAATADCAAPSPLDILDSDAFWSWPCASFLHVEISPAGESKGYVRSQPYYIDCPWACTRPFDPGAKVTLWALPSHGVTFDSWSGDGCAGQGNPCVVTVSGDMTVTANFVGDVTPAPPPASPPATLATLHVFMGNDFGSTVTGTDGLVCGGGVTLNCYQDYTVGQSVTVSDSNGGCEYFTDSLAGGTHSNPYTFTMTPETRTVAPHNSC